MEGFPTSGGDSLACAKMEAPSQTTLTLNTSLLCLQHPDVSSEATQTANPGCQLLLPPCHLWHSCLARMPEAERQCLLRKTCGAALGAVIAAGVLHHWQDDCEHNRCSTSATELSFDTSAELCEPPPHLTLETETQRHQADVRFGSRHGHRYSPGHLRALCPTGFGAWAGRAPARMHID